MSAFYGPWRSPAGIRFAVRRARARWRYDSTIRWATSPVDRRFSSTFCTKVHQRSRLHKGVRMHSLVTGGAGFIGSHVVDHLIQSGQQVTVADDLSGGYRGNVNSAASFVRADMSQIDAVDALFRANHFDRVYHLAAYAAEGLSHFIKRFNYTNNLISSVNLINASVRSSSVKCFVFTSSIAVYGEQQSPISEETTPLPEDPYGIAKYAVELDLAEASAMFGLRYVVFRPHNV